MKTFARRPVRLLSVLTAAVGLVAITAGFAGATAPLPDPCTLLTKAHAEESIAKGKTVTVKLGKVTKSGSGSLAAAFCPELVGTLTVSIYVSHSFGGFGGVQVKSTTHPTGLGSGDNLIVGTGPSGGPVDFIVFHTGGLYLDVSANGATPANLTTFARQVYKLLNGR